LASELYDSSTHFILEILQNADDSTYTSNPTLTLTLTRDFLHIRSNETGFTREDVDAICGLGQTTKSRSRKSTGEKGIGFKSVFKVADEVYVHSSAYSFMFDQRQQFGMIMPIWVDQFPVETYPDQTSIVLKMSDQYDRTSLVRELQGFDASLLLFLKKIRSVRVEIAWPQRDQRTFFVQRSDTYKDSKQLSEKTIDCNGMRLNYLVYNHTTTKLGPDPRRVDYTYSNLELAFPVEQLSCSEAPSPSQKVYATLPIGNFGLGVRG
jgi:hypothetical protein